MITRYPILEFLDRVTGVYVSDEAEFQLKIRKNGYGFVLLTESSAQQSDVYGVIGVAKENLELHASIGFPNIITLSWPHAFDEVSPAQEICFQGDDLDFCIILAFDKERLMYEVKLGERSKVKHLLVREYHS